MYKETIEDIKNNVKKLTPEQKKLIAINKEDVQYRIMYDFEVSQGAAKKYIRISVLFYYAPGFDKIMQTIKTDPRKQFELADEIKAKVRSSLCADYK